jgi:hypothetical protein
VISHGNLEVALSHQSKLTRSIGFKRRLLGATSHIVFRRSERLSFSSYCRLIGTAFRKKFQNAIARTNMFYKREAEALRQPVQLIAPILFDTACLLA